MPGHSTNHRANAAQIASLTNALAEAWPEATCEINHRNAYELLVGTILAAQSTDARINLLSPALFAAYPNATALAHADPATLEKLIFSSGFYRAKAKNLLGMAQQVVTRHGGEIPRTMAELVALPGVARKTANVVLGTAYGIAAGVVVDTHVTRLAQRLGLTSQTDAVKIEQDLCEQLPRATWISFPNRLIWHGRRVCHAKKPDCGQCSLAPLCPASSLPATAAATIGRKNTKRAPRAASRSATAAPKKRSGSQP